MKGYNFINGHVFDPRRQVLDQQNIAILNNNVIGLGYLPDDKDEDFEVFDIKDCIVVPNIIDSLVYQTYDNLNDLNRLALASGITGIGLYPQKPLKIELPEHITLILKRVKEECDLSVFPIGTLTRTNTESHNITMSEYDLMSKQGAVGFIDAQSINNALHMRHILTYCSSVGSTIMIQSSDDDLANSGLVNEGFNSTYLGLKSSPAVAEEIRIARDIQLAEVYGGKLYFPKVTTAKSVELIRNAKKKGLSVFAGTGIHYLLIDTSEIKNYDTNYKLNPPLRSQEDRSALLEGVRDGTIDVISSLHQPRTLDEKRVDFESALTGCADMQFLIPLIVSKLHVEEKIPLETLLMTISANVQKVFNIKLPGIALTNSPSFTVIDMKNEQVIEESSLISKGRNTVFEGQKFKGFARYTVTNGNCVFSTE